jgi:hypothetical protein
MRHKSNGGVEKTSIGKGQTFERSYGKDNSDHVGMKSAERGGKLGGSTTNLDHSISGASANQEIK